MNYIVEKYKRYECNCGICGKPSICRFRYSHEEIELKIYFCDNCAERLTCPIYYFEDYDAREERED